MKNIIRNAYIAKMTGIAENKNDKEIWWRGEYNKPITIEFPTSLISYAVVREYYENGNLRLEREYQNGKLHGKAKGWFENGNLRWQDEYQNGELHGRSLVWYENGNLYWDVEFQNGL